jgi:hypothetical protein
LLLVESQILPKAAQKDLVIDRYLALEDGERFINEELKVRNDQINTIIFQLWSLADDLKKEEDGASALIARKDEEEAQKTRLWDSMSKDQIRELGRQDVGRERQKLG